MRPRCGREGQDGLFLLPDRDGMRVGAEGLLPGAEVCEGCRSGLGLVVQQGSLACEAVRQPLAERPGMRPNARRSKAKKALQRLTLEHPDSFLPQRYMVRGATAIGGRGGVPGLATDGRLEPAARGLSCAHGV